MDQMKLMSTFKVLLEKVKTFEERLVKLEVNQLKDCVIKKPFEEQTININNTYTTLLRK